MFANAAQLKGWIKNKSKETGAHANVLLQNYMMERFLELISLSPYRRNIIIKGGFLIAAMVGVDKRTTMDLDTTIKGLPVSRAKIEKTFREIIAIDAGDGVTFEIQGIENIRDVSDYDDFRVSLRASFYTIHVDIKVDVTTGDIIIPREIEYQYKLMFEERTIPVMAYNLYTILAEKLETLLVRGVGNTRARDYYDIYILLSINKDTISRDELLRALREKATERRSLPALDNRVKILNDIAASPDIAKILDGYKKRYSYAKDIMLPDIIALVSWVFSDPYSV